MIRSSRDAVLAYRDLAEQLCQPPLDFQRPEQWNGFVPPEHFNGVRNPSPRRVALAALVEEAHARDDANAARRTA